MNSYDQGQMQYNYVCQKVMPHSYKIANKMLVDRLSQYKKLMGFVDDEPKADAAAG